MSSRQLAHGNMHHPRNYIKQFVRCLASVALVLPAVLLLVGCGMFDSDFGDCDNTSGSGTTYVQVKVQVSTGGDMRATRSPNGGEDGDGREPGYDNENKVNDITLLLYTKSDKAAQDAKEGINAADDDVTITHALYFPSAGEQQGSGNDIYYMTSPQEVDGLDRSKTYHMIVIANAGDLTSLKDKELSKIRDYNIKNAWTKGSTITDYSDFVMSSEDDAKLVFGDDQKGDGSETNPFTAEATIERIAARIDFDTEGNDCTLESTSDGTSTLTGYVYNVENTSGTETGDVFVLTHVSPFNEATYGSYLIKRVWDSTNGTAYLGVESATNNAATNYVIDPKTSDKATANFSAASEYYRNPYSTTGVATHAVQSPISEQTYYILDYTLENTRTDDKTDYVTGLYFTGKYYKKSEWSNGSPADNAGTTKTYVYYIRHSDPTGNGKASDPMHYGIVRNNIYRVKIEKVLGDSEGMQITINVRKWAKFTHTEIVM